jgi:hypothetical protein
VDVLSFTRLCAESEWRYLACLRQIANWHGRPVSEVDPAPFAGAVASGAMRRVDVGWLGRPGWKPQADSA